MTEDRGRKTEDGRQMTEAGLALSKLVSKLDAGSRILDKIRRR